MRAFNVLDPAQSIHQPLLLEASAGTGKTYSIENIVVRGLIENSNQGKPFTIEQILVVTFTKKAASELKIRIRKCIEKALYSLQMEKDLPPYLASLGKVFVVEAKQRLKQALAHYDESMITTIHAFCFRAIREHGLENNAWLTTHEEEDALNEEKTLSCLADLFRTKLFSEYLTSGQLNVLLKAHHYSVTHLAKELLHTISRGIKFEEVPSNQEILENLHSAFIQSSLTQEELLQSLSSYAHLFYGACEGRTKTPKQQYIQFLSRLTASLEKMPEASALDLLIDASDGFFATFSLTNVKKTAELDQEALCFTNKLSSVFYPFLVMWGEYPFLFQGSLICVKIFFGLHLKKKGLQIFLTFY